MYLDSIFFIVSVSSCNLLLGRTRSWDRCWAAIWLTHHREPSGQALIGKSMD